ncbi:MAG TPA: hypothetical protein VE549_08760, partial [Myxococcaceae bacterium]|nr:hypothetical protein [Myxococcaceae bacterium]
MPVIAGVVLIAAAGLVLAGRPDATGRLAIGPTPRAEDAASWTDATATGPATLSQRSLSPLPVTSEVTGDGPLFDGAPDLTLVVGHRERLALV